MDYRQRIKALRKENKETQVELAKVCGTTDGNIGHWENLRGDIPIDALIKICQHYNVSADYILGLTDVKRPLFIDVSDHAFILGAAGTGKTATIKHLQEVLSESLSDDIE